MAQVYELLTTPNGVSYSPWVIYSHLYFKHKKLDFDSIPLLYHEISTEIKKLTNGQWALVPTVKFDNGDIVFDSPKIAEYLDEHYPEHPLKHGGPEGKRAVDTFFAALGQSMYKLIVLDVVQSVDPKSRELMIAVKEKEFGISLKEFAGDYEAHVKLVHEKSHIIAEALKKSSYLEGAEPGFNDYRVIGMFQSVRSINPRTYAKLITQNPHQEIVDWAKRLDELFGGYLKNRKTNE